MFFARMITKALRRQLGKRIMIAVTIALGAALTTSMMAVMLDIGDKVTQELSSYGANIEVTPKGASVVSETYGTTDAPSGALLESELPRLKSIFWAYNIEDFAPYLSVPVTPRRGGPRRADPGRHLVRPHHGPRRRRARPDRPEAAADLVGRRRRVGVRRRPASRRWPGRPWPPRTAGPSATP